MLFFFFNPGIMIADFIPMSIPVACVKSSVEFLAVIVTWVPTTPNSGEIEKDSFGPGPESFSSRSVKSMGSAYQE